MRVALGKRAFRSGHYLFRSTPQFLGKASQELKVAPSEAFRAAAADKFDAPILADFRAAADEEHADLAGALDVGAAAGLQVGGFDLDGAEDAVPVDFFSHAELRQLVRGAVAHVDWSILEDNLICGSLRALEDFLGRFRAPQIDGTQFASEMEGNRKQAEAFLKHGGQQVLAGVMLHVVEAAGPVDAAFRFAEFDGLVNSVDDFVLSIADVDDVGIAQLAEVVWLASGSRIEGGAIQNDFPGWGFGFGEGRNQSRLTTDDPCGEFRIERIVVIEPARGHSAPPPADWSARCQASAYLYPVPVLKSTTASSGLIQPEEASFLAAITVAAPSGAANIPSMEASSRPAWSISSSVTVSAVPFVCRSMLRIRRAPSGPGTRKPEAMVAAFGKN